MTPDISEAVANATLAKWSIELEDEAHAEWQVRYAFPPGPERDEMLKMLGLS